MPFLVKHLFANVRKTSDFRPDVTSIVLFGMEATDGNPVYLEIRFLDYDALAASSCKILIQCSSKRLRPGRSRAAGMVPLHAQCRDRCLSCP